jgi:uncharacterized integral membrane protein
MRYAYVALILLVTAAVLTFKIQNLDSVTVTFLRLSATMPVSVMVMLVYVLGMLSGSFVVKLVRSWVRGARRPPADKVA